MCVVSLAYCCDLIDSQTSREERMSAERADCKLCGQPPITLSQGAGRTRKHSSLNWPLGHSAEKKEKENSTLAQLPDSQCLRRKCAA